MLYSRELAAINVKCHSHNLSETQKNHLNGRLAATPTSDLLSTCIYLAQKVKIQYKQMNAILNYETAAYRVRHTCI